MIQKVLSPHEQRIEKGEAGVLTDEGARVKRARVNGMLKDILTGPPRVAVDRARLMTKSFKETEGLPLVLRWAKSLEHIAREIPIYIGPDELLVGRCGPGERCGLIYPELRGGWLENIKYLSERKVGQFYATEEDVKIVTEEIVSYWKGKTWHEAYYKLLPEDTQHILWDKDDIYKSTGIFNAITTQDSGLVWALDYEKVLKRGFDDIKREAQEKLSKVDIFDRENNYDKVPFYEAVIITSNAIVSWAKRYAELAKGLAKGETNYQRKGELTKIAAICECVPANPARTFHEAIQSVWFTNAFSRFEQIMAGQMGLGRIDQYLYPYYWRDKEEKRITDDDALELLECFWLNLARIRRLVQTSSIYNYQGYPHYEQACIGGQRKDGEDAVNELSYLILQSKKEFPLDFPDLSVRIHSLTPEWFLKKVCELIKEGTGFPKLYNDEEIIPLFLAKGATLEEARDYTGCGCAEVRLINRETYMTQGCQVNIAAALEMALRDGKMALIDGGHEQFGLKTGDPRGFKSYIDLWNAFKLQLENLFKYAFINRHTGDMTKPYFLAAPLQSCLHKLCMDQGLDIHQGQGKFKDDISLGNVFVIGFGTVIDSLTAIKKLVFDDMRITMSELLEALNVNFEGKEAVRQMCRNAPKYGNCDPYADQIGRNIDLVLCELTERYINIWKGKDNISYVPVTSHVGLGGVIGATPNGRKAGEALSEGISPTQGSDINGPTATLLSIANTRNSYMKHREARLLNLKLTPQVVAGEEGTKNLASFIRAWCDEKQWHMQFNIINRETLVAAQKDPEGYRNLLIRVAGFSAYFVDLSPELQNEIIARTEHQAI